MEVRRIPETVFSKIKQKMYKLELGVYWKWYFHFKCLNIYGNFGATASTVSLVLTPDPTNSNTKKKISVPLDAASTVVRAARPTVAAGLGNAEEVSVAAFLVASSTVKKREKTHLYWCYRLYLHVYYAEYK